MSVYIDGWAIITSEMIPVSDANEQDNPLDLMPLRDIVITGVENSFSSYIVDKYDPDAAGTDENPWGVLISLPESGQSRSVLITQKTVRQAVATYICHRLNTHSWAPARVIESLQSFVMDAPVADSILQFAVYGEDIFG